MSAPARAMRPPVGFFEAQRRQRQRTAALLGLELLLLCALGNLLLLPWHLWSGALAAGAIDRTNVVIAAGAAVAAALAMGCGAVYARHGTLDAPALRPADGPEHARLRRIVDDMSVAAGVVAPQLLLLDDPAPNAYAVAAGRRGGVVVLTSGIVDLLDERELTGVVAHELAHLRHRDSVVIWTASVAAGVVVGLAGALVVAADRGRRHRPGVDPATGRPLPARTLRQIDQDVREQARHRRVLRALAAALWLGVRPLALLVRAAVSRRRELLADAAAVQFTRDPTGLRSALERLAAVDQLPVAAGVLSVALWIHSPRRTGRGGTAGTDGGRAGAPLAGRWRIARLLDPHPPIAARIAWLRQLERGAAVDVRTAPV